jgi:transposase
VKKARPDLAKRPVNAARAVNPNEVAAILARLRRSRIVCSDETSVRIDGRTHWNWAEPAKVPPMRGIGGRRAEGVQNDQVVIHVVRDSRAASVVTEVMAGHRPVIWSPTSTARSRAMPICGKFAWRISYAIANTPSTRAIRFSPRA